MNAPLPDAQRTSPDSGFPGFTPRSEGRQPSGDPINMKLTTNTHSLLRRVGVLSLAALLASHAMANPSQGTLSTNSAPAAEPRRIFDAEKERFVPNPDYRGPAVVKQGLGTAKPAPEPRRIFDAEKERFVSNPAYHPPIGTVQAVRRVGEPRRIFDAEKERFVPNPDYRGPGVAR